MTESLLNLGVVGHTNAGKTSLLRTLLQNPEFGDVAAAPSTTRDVIRAWLDINGQHAIALYDTPGLEAGTDLYDLFGERFQSSNRHDGPGQVEAFLQSSEAQGDFEQEAKVLRQLLQCDAAFYVVDIRDPVLPKYQDELDILSRCGKPLLPVFNFAAAANHYGADWRKALAAVNLHNIVEFDAFSPPEGGEQQLLSQLMAVLPQARPVLETLQQQRLDQRNARLNHALQQLAEMVLDVASYRMEVSSNEEPVVSQAVRELQQRVRRREQTCLESVLALYDFKTDTATLAELNIDQGEWQDDLFDSHTLKDFGIRAGKGATTGAAAGAGVDLMFGGMSLGAGTLLGATIGGVYQGWQTYGKRIRNRLRGGQELVVEERIIRLLGARQHYLINTLHHMGHGSSKRVSVSGTDSQSGSTPWAKAQLPDCIKRVRSQAQLSARERTRCVKDLADFCSKAEA